MSGLQLAFFCQVCKLIRRVLAPIVFAELADVPSLRAWLLQVVGFMHRLASMPQAKLHAEILSDNILDFLQDPTFDDWATGVQMQCTSLGTRSRHAQSGTPSSSHVERSGMQL